MEQWNNVELTNISKKSSYTLNHQYDNLPPKKYSISDESEPRKTSCNDESTKDAQETGNTAEMAQDAKKIELNAKSGTLQPGADIKPKVTTTDVEGLVQRLYGITTSSIRELISYDDRNYLIKEDTNIKNPIIVRHWPHGYVLKILNSLDSKKEDFVDGQNQLMLYLSKESVQCPKPIANVYGKYYSVEHINGGDHIVRLLEFIPGQIFHEVPKSNYLLYQSGEYLAKIDRALKNFKHEAYETHKTLWMLESVPQLKDFLYVLQDFSRKALVEEIIEAFEENVLSQLPKLEKQVIHGDYNEQNIVVEKLKNSDTDYKVTGIIDFGDTNKSPAIFEIGIALAYMMLQAKSLESGGIFLAGYNSVRNITAKEKSLLKYCVAARLAQSLVLGAYTHSLDPSNEYVLVTQEQGWKLIDEMWREQLQNIDELWETTADKYLTQSIK